MSDAVRVDITQPANAARHIYVATFILLWMWFLVASISLWMSSVGVPLLLLSCFCIFASLYARRLDKWTYRAFIFGTLALAGVLFWPMSDLRFGNLLSSITHMLKLPMEFGYGAIAYLFFVLILAFGMFSTSYPTLRTTPLEMAAAMTQFVKQHRSPVSWLHWPNRPILAAIWGVLSIAAILVVLGVIRTISDKLGGTSGLFYLLFLVPISFADRFRRSYMLSADKVLALDTRQPVVFLRSFAADHIRLWGKGVLGKLRGNRIDQVISPLANTVGPFIAIANPQSKLPFLGAAKTYYTDETWQTGITKWVNMAKMIVMVAGRTEGVRWEIGHIFQSQAQAKLVILIPSPKQYARAKEYEAAVDDKWFREAFADTPYLSTLTSLDLRRTIAVVFRKDDIVAIESRRARRSAIDYWTAFQLALFTSVVKPERLAEDEAHERVERGQHEAEVEQCRIAEDDSKGLKQHGARKQQEAHQQAGEVDENQPVTEQVRREGKHPQKYYNLLLMTRRLAPLFFCQFFTAFGDNFLKTTLGFVILAEVAGPNSGALITLAGATIIAPFFFLSGVGGELADRYDKALMAQRIKFVELGAAAFAVAGFAFHSVILLFLAVFMFGTLATLFGPIKYGILPDHLSRAELPAGNALIEAGTFLAILLGAILAGIAANGESNSIHFAWPMLVAALASYLSSLLIPRTGEGAPHLVVNPNILVSTFHIIKALREDPRLWWGAIVVSWFWLVGALVLSVLLPLVHVNINGTEAVITLFLTIFSVAVAIGSGLAAWLAAGRIVILPTLFGAVLIGLFSLDLGWISGTFAAPAGTPLGIAAFFAEPRSIHIVVDLAVLAIGGGLFAVPTFAAVQAWALPDRRARVIAGVNMLGAAFMVIGTLIQGVLQSLGLGVSALFAIIGVANLLVAVVISRTMPTNMIDDFRWVVLSR